MLNETGWLKSLSIRRKQAFATLCLVEFCAAKGIESAAVGELVEHLLSILVSDNLTEWEARGAKLELAGRGDPLPDSVRMGLPPGIHEEVFQRLVEHVVEVGIVDMYGALSERPLQFLLDCIKILKSHGVDPPSSEAISNLCGGASASETGWGMPLKAAEHKALLHWCRTKCADQ